MELTVETAVASPSDGAVLAAHIHRHSGPVNMSHIFETAQSIIIVSVTNFSVFRDELHLNNDSFKRLMRLNHVRLR